MKVGSTDEFLLLFHFVPVLFTTITFFPWHYKTFCQISRWRGGYRVSITDLKWHLMMLEPRLIRSLISWKTLEYKVKTVTFSSVHHLSLHFPTNFGEDIGLAGKCTEANRVGKINAVYEARAVPEDHTMAYKEKMFIFEIIKSIEQATQNIKMFLQLVMENLYFVKILRIYKWEFLL